MNKKTLQIVIVTLIVIIVGGVIYIKKTGTFAGQELTGVTEGKFKYNVDGDYIDYAELFKDKLPVIGVYGSENCPACKRFEPIAMQFNKEYEGKVYVKYIDVRKHGATIGNIPVQSIPTQVFFDKNGEAFQPTDEEIKRFNLNVYKNNNGKIIYTTHNGILPYEDMVAIVESMGVKNDR